MVKRLVVFILFVAVVQNMSAQMLPVNGAKLHYNQIMFEYEKVNGAHNYLIQITADTVGSNFDNPIIQKQDSSTATLVSGLAFGKKYKWRYAGKSSSKEGIWHGPYYFETDIDSFINRNIVNFTVTQNDTGNTGLIVIDATHTIVDRNGNLVWYLTNVNWFYKYSTRSVSKNDVTTVFKDMEVKPNILDMRVTPAGTVTFLKDSFAVECDLNSNKLWQAPNDGLVSGIGGEGYNHDFKRLPDSHYMILGSELWRKLPAYSDTVALEKSILTATYLMGTSMAK